jgi:hypothetical protein
MTKPPTPHEGYNQRRVIKRRPRWLQGGGKETSSCRNIAGAVRIEYLKKLKESLCATFTLFLCASASSYRESRTDEIVRTFAPSCRQIGPYLPWMEMARALFHQMATLGCRSIGCPLSVNLCLHTWMRCALYKMDGFHMSDEHRHGLSFLVLKEIASSTVKRCWPAVRQTGTTWILNILLGRRPPLIKW